MEQPVSAASVCGSHNLHIRPLLPVASFGTDGFGPAAEFQGFNGALKLLFSIFQQGKKSASRFRNEALLSFGP